MKDFLTAVVVAFFSVLIFLIGVINGINYRIEKSIAEKQIFYDGKTYSVIEETNE